MEHIKTTPPELGVPSYDIEWNDEAKVLAKTTYNPGVPDDVFERLARKVVGDMPTLKSRQWRERLVHLAQKYLSQPSTEKIVNKTQVGVGHVLTDLEPTDNDHQPRFGYDPDGNGAA